MVIQKEIDLKALQSVVEDAMQNAIDNCEEVKINLIVAHDIIAVIKEAHKSEKQDKLKPIKSFIGTEDAKRIAKIACNAAVLNGTQSNEEYTDKIKNDCFGTYDGDIECECCDVKKECEEEMERKNWECEEETNKKYCAVKIKKRNNEKNEKN